MRYKYLPYQTRNTAHSDVSRGLRNALQPRSVHSGYYIVQRKDYVKPLIHLIRVCADIALISTSLPSSMLHLLHIIDNMVGQSILLGLLSFFVHGRSTICTTVPLTSVVMQSDLRYLLLRRRVHYIKRDASFFVATDPTILAYSSATFSKHY